MPSTSTRRRPRAKRSSPARAERDGIGIEAFPCRSPRHPRPSSNEAVRWDHRRRLVRAPGRAAAARRGQLLAAGWEPPLQVTRAGGALPLQIAQPGRFRRRRWCIRARSGWAMERGRAASVDPRPAGMAASHRSREGLRRRRGSGRRVVPSGPRRHPYGTASLGCGARVAALRNADAGAASPWPGNVPCPRHRRVSAAVRRDGGADSSCVASSSHPAVCRGRSPSRREWPPLAKRPAYSLRPRVCDGHVGRAPRGEPSYP